MTTALKLVSTHTAILSSDADQIPYSFHHLTALFTLSVTAIRSSPLLQSIADLSALADQAENDGQDIHWEQDLILSHPTDLTKSSGLLIVDFPNRGNCLIGLPNGASHTQPPTIKGYPAIGNATIQKHGHTTLSLGWQGHLATVWDTPFLGARYPSLKETSGWVDFVHVFDDAINTSIPLVYPMANPTDIHIQVLPHPHPGILIMPDIQHTIESPTEIKIERPPNTDAGTRYSVRYLAKDPILQGLAFVGTKLLAQHLRSGASPYCPPISKIITLGVSQTSRLQRDFLASGFAPSSIFDGHFFFIPGSKLSFTNKRWAQPGRSGLMYEDPLVWGGVRTTETSGEGAGVGEGYESLLELGHEASGEADNPPKIFHTDTSGEFYQAGSSLLTTRLTATGAIEDLPIPPNVRHYMIASASHAPYPTIAPPPPGLRWQPNNLNWLPVFRALFFGLVDWVMRDVEPAPSCWPRVDSGELVAPLARDLERAQRGLQPLGSALNLPPDVEYLAAFNPLGLTVSAGDFQIPSQMAHPLPVLVPISDADGLDLCGIRLPHVVVPDGNRLGWSLRATGFDGGLEGGMGVISRFMGARVAFAETKAERIANNDKRLSLEERYPGGEEEANERRMAVARELVTRRLMLEEDIVDSKKFLA